MVQKDPAAETATAEDGNGAPTAWRAARKLVVGVAGVTVIAVGVVLIPLPGPGWLIVFAGMAILATEFPAARRKLDEVKARARSFLEGRS